MNREKYQRIIKGFIPSRDVRKHLLFEEADDEMIARIIRGAPVSLWKKARYAEGEDKSAVMNAISALCNVRSGEVLYRKYCTYEPQGGECEHPYAPYLSYTEAINDIRQDCQISRAGSGRNILEKWVSDGTGRMRLEYVFDVIEGDVMYFTHMSACHPFRFSFEGRRIKLPTPFLTGDRVVIDCMDGKPPRNGVILATGDLLNAIYKDGDGYYKIANLTGPVPGDAYCNAVVSPLFLLEYLRGKTAPGERLLKRVSELIYRDETRGRSILNMILRSSAYGITDDELMDIIS